MIHHLGVFASDLTASRAFYMAALRPLGIEVGYETDRIAEFWHRDNDTPSLSLEAADATQPASGVHLAFVAKNREQVDQFFREAMAAGAVARHAPRLWPEYRAYCAFVNDPDGNNIEAVHKEIN